MLNRFNEIRARRAQGEKGFTLIELLVVVVIIGVLIAIALPLYMNYKKGAENKAAQSDVRNAVTAIENCYADNSNVYPDSVNGTGSSLGLTCGGTSDAQKINVSDNVTLNYNKLSDSTYTVDAHFGATADGYKTYTYDSTTGKTTSS